MKNRTRKMRYKFRQRKTSMFFVLWAAFAMFSFLLLFVFSVSQRYVLKDTYSKEAVRSLGEKGKRIYREIRQAPPVEFGQNYDGFIRYLSVREEVQICILDGDGNLLMPLEENIDPSSPLWGESYDFTDEIKVHKEQLEKNGATLENGVNVIYSTDGGVVFGVIMPAKNGVGENTYLYVYQSMKFVQVVEHSLNVRMLWIAVFVFALSFAVSSAISGAITRPIDEISAKAKRLATGDFDVDFQGEDYLEEMDALSASLNFAKDELSKADRMQKELIANVSHDFKTPLTMIKAYAEMIVEFAGDDKMKRDKSARVIMEEADRLASLVSDVLDISKIRSGIQQLDLQPFDVCAYLHEILARFDYLTETQGYVFEVDADKGLYTVADQMKIGQVLYNLIGNAVNYTGEDKRVLVRLKKERDVIRFSVTDTGSGIKPEEIDGIWERYYRSREAHKRPVQGTGLGLSIVKTILDCHQFLYGIESEYGHGSTFYVIFPLKGEEVTGE